MSEQQAQATEQTTPQAQAEQAQPQGEKLLTFTQEQMNALMSREKHEGKDSVYRALGLDPKDKAAIEQAKAKLTSQQKEAQPVSDKQEQAKQEQPATQPPKQTNAVLNAEAKVALLGAGVQPELLDDALTLLLHKVEKSEQVQAEVDALKAKHNVLFKPTVQTTGRLVGNTGTAVTAQEDYGARLAKARYKTK